jgi:signal peptidase I
MKNIISIEQFLFESKATAKKRFLDRGLVSEEIFDRFLDVDTTPTKKFIEKMCEFFVAGSSEGDVVETFEKVISLSERQILSFDISLIKSLSELQSLVSSKENYKSRSEKRFIAQKGAEVTYEDDRFLVLYITTKDASKKYGKGTKWCISAEKDNQWDYYYKNRGSRFYFIIDYKTKFKTLSKIAVEFDEYNKDVTVWNTTDNKGGKLIDFNYIDNQLGIPESAFNKHNEIMKFKKTYGILGDYTINPDGSVDVDGDVKMVRMGLTKIPVKFGKVGGYFDCSDNHLTSLEFAPSYVGGSFSCQFNKLTSLEFAPSYVSSTFYCYENNLTSLEGCPYYVGGWFDCSKNLLTSLEFAPSKVGGYFNCSYNNLTSLKFAPTKMLMGDFNCSSNLLTNLEGAPSYVNRGFWCGKNNLTSLEGAPLKVRLSFDCSEQKNGHRFTEEEVKAVCRVDKNIHV